MVLIAYLFLAKECERAGHFRRMHLEDMNEILVLHGRKSSLVLEASPTQAPLWRYWGPRLEGLDPSAVGPLRAETPPATFSLENPPLFSLFPTFGLGWYGAPALLASRGSEDFAQAITACTWTWLEPDTALAIEMLDDIARIRIDIELRLDPDNDGLTISTKLTNVGREPLQVQWLASACLPLPPHARSVRTFGGRHNSEFEPVDAALGRATWLRENRRGLTSHDCLPAALVMCEGATRHAGSAYGAQLAWSGSHRQRIDWLEDGRFQWQLGTLLAPGEGHVQPGSTLLAPDVLATCSPEGLNGVAQAFHDMIRKRMNWPSGYMKPRPVHLNTWEGLYFKLEEQALFDMASAASSLGVERFVLDDGWFKGRRDDTAGLGDWWVDSDVFPSGLGPLASHVNALGMEFGLWVEPEMVNQNSDLFRAHPDWALQLDGRPHLTARNQLVLDLSREEVFSYIFSRLESLLDSLPISYLKWDHNRDLCAAGTGGAPSYVNQVNSTYRLLDAIGKRWPNLEIEACAGGGGRIDAGILQRTHRVWTSDCLDALSRIKMQRGFLQFFPPEIMGSHIGAAPAHATGRSQSVRFRGSVAIAGHFGLELDPRILSGDQLLAVKDWVQTYKHLRNRLHTDQIWLGECGDGVVWQAHGTKEECILIVQRLEPSHQTWPPTVPLPFLVPQDTYVIKRVGPDLPAYGQQTKFFRDLEAKGVTMSGAWLAAAGLPLPNLKAETALIISINKV
jgi:alpha-galactosidase